MEIKDLGYLSKAVKDLIQEETYQEIITGKQYKHSLQTITKENRTVAVGARMTSRPFNWNQFTLNLNNSQIVATGSSCKYTGKDIADIFINSVLKHGNSYYPLPGDWRKNGVQQLVLFIKDNAAKRYVPYARFSIDEIISSSRMTAAQLANIIDITPVCYCQYKTVLHISDVQTTNLPTDYIGNNSGVSIYDLAFSGSSPNILMI